MNIMWQYLVFFGAAAQIFGDFYYIKNTLWGKTKPNRVTWFMWAAGPLIAASAALSAGAGWASLPVFAAGLGPLLVFIASFANKKSYWKLGAFDYLCGFFSVLALVLWALTSEPAVAIVLAIVSDVFACVPTIVKSWKYPETESGLTHIAGLFNALTSFTAISFWSFTSLAFPVYLAIGNSALAFSVYRRKIFKK
jgi:hypothetical protein